MNPSPHGESRAPLFKRILITFGIAIAVVGGWLLREFIRAPSEEESQASMDIAMIDAALTSYYEENGTFPPTNEELQTLSTKEKPLRLTDPWGQPYVYQYPGKINPDWDIWSLGEDGVESEDDVKNW